MKSTTRMGGASAALRVMFPMALLLALGGAQAQPSAAMPESAISKAVQNYGDCLAASLDQAKDLASARFETAASRTCAGHRSRMRELIGDERALEQIDRRILEHLRGQSEVPHGTAIRRPER